MSVSPAEWLAKADPDPEHAKRWLSSARILLLPLGRLWDVVKVPRLRGLAAVEMGVDGPVIHDPAGQAVFFLVPVGTAIVWDVDGTVCLGDACYLATPVPVVKTPPGPHWLQAPDGSGQLVDPETLRDALTAVSMQSTVSGL